MVSKLILLTINISILLPETFDKIKHLWQTRMVMYLEGFENGNKTQRLNC